MTNLSAELDNLGKKQLQKPKMRNDTHLEIDFEKNTIGLNNTREFSAENCTERVALEALNRIFEKR